jgi:two-component system, OmpR family, response regulator VicR
MMDIENVNIDGVNMSNTNINDVKVDDLSVNNVKVDNMNIDNVKVDNMNIDNVKIIDNVKMNNLGISNIPKRVLVIDDEPDNLELVKFVLEGEGFEVTIVNNGLEALAKFCAVEFDLVLLDIMLPDIAGWDVLKKIKERNAAIPVIIVTAKTRNINKLLGMKVLKADDYVTKPFLKKELIDKVKRLTESSVCTGST